MTKRLPLLLALAALVLAGCGGEDAAAPVERAETTARPAEAADVVDLENVLALRSDFEEDAGKTRVILLLSPT